MAVTRVVLALLVGVVAMTTSVESRCPVNPQFWCDTYEIAEKCGVLTQCRQFLNPRAAKPVDVTLYYESLCPGCKQFMATKLFPTWQKIGKIMNVNLSPYGNTLELPDGDHWRYHCQHGPQECVGNLIEVCAIDLLKNIDVYFPFIVCFEKNITYQTKNVEPFAAQCAKDQKIDFAPILACSKSMKGNALEHKLAVATDALKPPHQYVPWITVNGVHTEKQQDAAQNDLLKLVCDTYTGSPKPAGCPSEKYGGADKSFRKTFQ